MAAPRKVRVPQADGEIVFGTGTPGEARTYQVDNHLVSPRSNDEQDDLLRLVEGARLATPKEMGESTDKPGSDAGAGKPSGDK